MINDLRRGFGFLNRCPFFVTVARTVLGVVFVFSGFVKSVDPWGTALKIGEYMAVWGVGTMGDGVRMATAIALCAGELALGLALVAGLRSRLVSLATLVVMSVFVVVTLLGATVLPVGDCGCFGEVVSLGPWASFAKNVVLWGLALWVWLDARKRLPGLPATRGGWIAGVVFALVAVGLGVWSYRHLPPIDFLPYHKGVYLREALRDGGEEDIRLREFALFDSEGDATGEAVDFAGTVYLLCAARLDEVGECCGERFAEIVARGSAEGARVMVLTSSAIEAGQRARFGEEKPVPIYNIDRGVLSTMLRARTGMVTLRDGVITDKKNCRDL